MIEEVIRLFVCKDCLKTFEEPEHYIETHGLDTYPYEEWDGCPYCAGAYTKTYQCDGCQEWITGEYIKTENGERYCESCYMPMELGDEE